MYARGWLNYYGIASMKNNIDDINGWLYHRIRMCIWKQWKLPRTKKRNLIKKWESMNTMRTWRQTVEGGHWYCANLTTVSHRLLLDWILCNIYLEFEHKLSKNYLESKYIEQDVYALVFLIPIAVGRFKMNTKTTIHTTIPCISYFCIV